MNIQDLIDGGAHPEDREAFNQLEQQKELIASRTLELAMMVHSVLGTGRGPELLDYLRERTIELSNLADPSLAVEAPQFPVTPDQLLFIREGQNSVVRHLEGLIRHAREASTQPATPPEGN